MMRKMHVREVMAQLTIKEFTRLCQLIDLGFGKKEKIYVRNGIGLWHAKKSAAVRFNVYEIVRTEKTVVIAVDIGHGRVGRIDLKAMEQEVKKIFAGGRKKRAA
jgi:hypothetical protein